MVAELGYQASIGAMAEEKVNALEKKFNEYIVIANKSWTQMSLLHKYLADKALSLSTTEDLELGSREVQNKLKEFEEAIALLRPATLAKKEFVSKPEPTIESKAASCLVVFTNERKSYREWLLWVDKCVSLNKT